VITLSVKYAFDESLNALEIVPLASTTDPEEVEINYTMSVATVAPVVDQTIQRVTPAFVFTSNLNLLLAASHVISYVGPSAIVFHVLAEAALSNIVIAKSLLIFSFI